MTGAMEMRRVQFGLALLLLLFAGLAAPSPVIANSVDAVAATTVSYGRDATIRPAPDACGLVRRAFGALSDAGPVKHDPASDTCDDNSVLWPSLDSLPETTLSVPCTFRTADFRSETFARSFHSRAPPTLISL